MKKCNCCITYNAPDLTDGGVTAARIEKEAEPDEGAHIGPEGEVDWHGLYLSENRRAEKAERERDEARDATCADKDAHWRLDEALEDLTERTRERDEALRALGEALESHDETLRKIAEGKYAAESRPLTPDAITDEMRGRARKAAAAQMPDSWWGGTEWWRYADEILTAALTEPTPEPTDAERLVDVLVRSPFRLAGIRDIADHLASEGVRAPGDES